ncbi:MAG: non-homologous end-joining DNA ligase [Thermoleophilia bacterium]|nr:non-homologous end-joining DNA ligase [Thermoleophilia bacterium]
MSMNGDTISGVTLTHPGRVFWPLDGITKRDLAAYYEVVASLMLPYVIGRPVSMLRCPSGLGELPEKVRQGRGRADACFFHKHPGDDFPGPFERVMITESGGPAPYLVITEAASLTALAQMGVLEIHVWGSTWPDIEHPDMLVFDLDPDPAVPWAALADGARLVRGVLQEAGLESFVKTTGGKGLHVVVPIAPSADWEVVRPFCKAVADAAVTLAPDRFTANMSKAKRGGKIFIDYVRNNRGATAIAPYSTRARERATVAVPLRWAELSGRARPDTYTIKNLASRLRQLKRDPWDGYFETGRTQTLTAGMNDAPAS